MTSKEATLTMLSRRISDLAYAKFQATHPPMIGGDPTTAANDALTPRVRELTAEISQAHQDATSRRVEFDRLRSELAARAEDVSNPDSPAFKAAHEASQAYDESVQILENKRRARDQLLEMTHPVELGQDDRQYGRMTVGSAMTPSNQPAWQRALESDQYKEWAAKNAFTQHKRKSVDGIMVPSDGEAGRDQFISSLGNTNDTLSHTLVTGLDAATGAVMITPDRQPGMIPLRTRPLRLADLITVGRTDSDTIEYVEMTGITNNAAEVAEATATTGTSGTKPESALALAERTVNVRTIAHWIPATKRALSDAGQLRTLIEQVLRLGLDLRLDTQLASGSGTGENLRGIYNTPGIAAITRRLAVAGNTNMPETVMDVIHRGITTVRLAFFEPNAVGINPLDFELLRLQRATPAVANAAGTAGSFGAGDYIMGDPMDGDTGVTIWGLRPVVSAAFTQGMPIVGDWNQMVMWLREGVQVLASDSHSDFFIRNMVAILAEFRAAVGVLAPPAFATVAF